MSARVETAAPAGLDYAEAFARQQARTDLAPGLLGVHRWYLRRPAGPVTAPPLGPDYQMLTARQPPVAYYRFLYGAVGRDWLWYERLRLPAERLAALLARESVSVTTLFRDGVPQGYFELNTAPEGEPAGVVSIDYFGLMPWAVGQGLGPRLLGAAVEAAGGGRNAVTLNTCTLDHPAALPTYQRAGFVAERAVQFDDPDPRLAGLLPRETAPHVPLARGAG